MRFKVSIINELAHFHNETDIAHNKKIAIWNLQISKPMSNLL